MKGESLHQVCKTYKSVCLFDESYTGETFRNIEIRCDKHNNSMKKSNPSKHNKDNHDHVFNWSVLANDPKKVLQRKVLQVHYYIIPEKPTLNNNLSLTN